MSTFAEDLDKSAFETPADYVMENAFQKAKRVFLTADPVGILVIGVESS